jgi:YidC/Oxa1 family membrane protein insertase
MTRSPDWIEDRVTRLQHLLVRLAPLLFIVVVAVIAGACVPGLTGGGGGSPTPTPTLSQAPLEPAQPGANPVELLAWLFTPIFRVLFITLTFFNQIASNIVVAIILLTIALRVLVIPLYRRQLVQSRQMQLLQPEIKEIQRKYKGDRTKAQLAVQEFYKQRGVNPASGCLPTLLQFGLLIPMYSVISQGLTNFDPSAMWQVFGINLFPGITCPPAPIFNPQTGHVINACLQPYAFGINWGIPEPDTTGLKVLGFGLSFLAVISSLAQLVASRMTLPPHDPRMADDQNTKVQRQMAYFLPLISILYGGIIPAGLFVYWITATLIQIVQQYLILGWGGMFPLLGWYPEFARNHTPRFPVKQPEPKPGAAGESMSAAERSKTLDRDLSAQSTIRPKSTRSGRRGRRR